MGPFVAQSNLWPGHEMPLSICHGVWEGFYWSLDLGVGKLHVHGCSSNSGLRKNLRAWQEASPVS